MPYFPLRKQSEPRIRRHEAYRILATPETYASSGDMEEEVFPSFEIQTSFNLSSPDKVVVESSKRTFLSDDLFSPKPETRQGGPIVANEAVADAWLRMGDSNTFGSKASNSVLPSSATTTTTTTKTSVPSQSIFRRTSHWWTAPCLHNASLMEAMEDHSVTTTTIVHSSHKSTSSAPFWWRTKGRRATDESRGRSRTRHPEVGRRNATGQSLLGSSPTTFRATRNTKVPQASKSTQPLRNGNRVKAGTRVVVASLFDSPPEQQQPIFVSSSSPASCDTNRFNLHQQTLQSLDGKHKQKGGRMTGADCKWKTAVDPKSGKTYYYHVETRETQWRKPIELASDAEREAMQEKERKQRDFFSAMEANILRNLQAGTFASSSSSSPKKSCGMLKNELNLADQDTTNEDDDKNKNTKEKGGKSVKRPDLVRTISSMDERILKDLVLRVPSHRNVGSAGDDSPTDVTTTKSPNHTAAQRLESDDSMEDMEVLSMMESDSSVFPPRPNALRNSKARQPSLGTVLAALPEESVSSMESFGDLSMHDMGLTDLESQALINYAQASSQMALLGDESFVGEMDQSFGGLTLEEPEVEEEEDTPPPCNPEDPLQHMDQEPVKRSIARGVGSHRVLSGETTLPPKPAKMSRRNTCGTLYVGSTLSQPDVDATIKCVCGVFRAHILQSEMEDSCSRPDYALFNDQESHQGRGSSSQFSLPRNERPTLDQVSAFYRDVFQKAQMESDCIIMSLIYVERLIKSTDGKLRPHANNWRSVLFSSMVLASKVWDDLSMWNGDFSQTCPTGVKFSLQRINELELAVLEALGYKVKVPASEYAKYYFLLRAMLIKSGLGGDAMKELNPLDVEGARRLQTVSTKYQRAAFLRQVGNTATQRSKSLTIDRGFNLPADAERKGKVSLEHMVQM